MAHDAKFVVVMVVGISMLTWLAARTSAAEPDQSMAFPGRNWEQASPRSQGLDAAKLDAAAEYLKKNSGRDGVRELLVIRNGRLVWKGEDVDTDGVGGAFVERVIFADNLGGHEAVAADVDGDGDVDLCSKLWRPRRDNANGGRNHADYLENLLIQRVD